jgi:hypothetical protein
LISATSNGARVLAIASATLLTAHAFAIDAVWIGPPTGAFNNPAHWSTGTVPTFNTAALIDDNPAQNTRVESTTGRNVNLIGIDAGDTLAVINSQFGAGMLPLDGTISVEGTGQFMTGIAVLNPGSEIRLNNAIATATASYLYNEGLLHGGGRVTINTQSSGPASFNENLIRADHPTIPLTLQLSVNANLINNGRLTATDGGRLIIQRGNSSNSFGVVGGRIESHPGSTVTLGTITIPTYVEGSVLALVDDEDPLTAAPKFEFAKAGLKDVTLEGNFKMSGATIMGTLTNPGELMSNPSVFPNYPDPHNGLASDVSLVGGGTVNLSGTFGYMFGGQAFGSPNYRLTNVDNVIRGNGELVIPEVGFTNRHIVQADTPATVGQAPDLRFFNHGQVLINPGVMKAINGGKLRLSGGGASQNSALMENFEGADAGEIIAGENSTVILNLIQIKGGVLRAVGDDPATRGKFVVESGGAVFENLTTEGVFRFVTSTNPLPTPPLSTITLSKRINNTGSMTARFAIGQSAELAGGGEMVGETGTFISLGVQNSTFVNVDNLIHGSGNINTLFTNNRFINRGTLRSDGAITIASQLPVVNGGRLEAGPGATLTLPTLASVLNYEGGVDGVIHAANGGVVNFERIQGGILSTDGTGVIRGTTAFLTDVHNLGTLEVNSVVPQGAIVNDGVIKGSLNLGNVFARLDGSGRWETTGALLDNGVFIHGPQHTILGSGNLTTISSPTTMFINEGTIRAVEGQPLNIRGMSFENSGLVHAPVDRTLGISSTFTRAENSGTLQVDGYMGFYAPPGLHNDGLIDLSGQLVLEETILRNQSDGMIVGNGEILGGLGSNTQVVNGGVIEPGEGLATLTISDDFQQLAGGRLEMELAGGETPMNDVLAINGNATLAGTVEATLVGEESLALHDSFALLTATGGITGTFNQWVLPDLPDDQFWFIEYGANEVRATVEEIIPGDFNLDGHVDAGDFITWAKTGGSAENYATWQANFGRSIASVGPPPSATAPEPASVWMLLSALIFIGQAATRTTLARAHQCDPAR